MICEFSYNGTETSGKLKLTVRDCETTYVLLVYYHNSRIFTLSVAKAYTTCVHSVGSMLDTVNLPAPFLLADQLVT